MFAKSNFRSRVPMKETKEFDEEVIQIDRVTRVVKGGRRMRFRATVVIGNRKGKIGIGIGKSHEVTGAIQKAINKAKRNIITVPIVNDTIPHDIQVKFKSAKVLLLPAVTGTGTIAGGPIRKVIELSGIKNILSKALGCSNPVNNTKAAFLALSSLKPLRQKPAPKKILDTTTKAKIETSPLPATPLNKAAPQVKKADQNEPSA